MRAQNLSIGMPVHWIDPDGGLCSCDGVIESIGDEEYIESGDEDIYYDDTIVIVRREDGTTLEASPCELRKITKTTKRKTK